MKKLILPASLLLLMIFFLGCDDNPSGLLDTSGVYGRVFDENGKPLEGVKVYCTFMYNNPPAQVLTHYPEKPLSVPDTFNLFQNYPNPFSNSTYIRFSLPEESYVELKMMRRTGEILFTYSKTLSAGYYQKEIPEIVDSMELKSGMYKYSLRAVTKSKKEYYWLKKAVVVSILGKPNSVSSSNGSYSFQNADAFIGDTLVIDYSNYIYKEILTSTVNLSFIKEGYLPASLRCTLYPNMIITEDVVLKELKEQ